MKRLGFMPDLASQKPPLIGTERFSGERGHLRSHLREILNQGNTNSCVANAFASGLALRNVAKGGEWELPSRRFIYRNARLLLGPFGRKDGKEKGTLLDDGCRPADAVHGMNQLGAPLEKDCPFSTSLPVLNRRPSTRVRQLAVDRTVETRSIASLEQLLGALSSDLPVAVAYNVDRAFLYDAGPKVIDDFDQSDIAGGHMVLAIDFDPDKKTIIHVNSYGKSWRDGGLFELPYDVVTKRGSNECAIL